MIFSEEPVKKLENLAKIEEDPYIKEIKNIQNKDIGGQKDQPGLKRPDSAKYLPPQNNKIEQPKPVNILNNQVNPNNIMKQNPQPIIKPNIPSNNNNNIASNIYQKPQNIVQSNVNNNILMRNDKQAQPSR